MSDISEHDTDSETEETNPNVIVTTAVETNVADTSNIQQTDTQQTQENSTTSIVDELKQQASALESKPEWQQYLEQSAMGAYTYTDPTDGTVYEWDEQKRGWIPKIDDNFIAHYQANYGFTATGEHDPNVNMDDDEEEEDKEAEEKRKKEEEEKKKQKEDGDGKKRKVQPEWFKADNTTNNNVYVSGLPQTTTEEAFVTLMSKYGIIMMDDAGEKKIKLYKNTDGTFKGDARCCYLKHESVGLAIDLLDESYYEGKQIHVEQAVFEMKGVFDPSLKPKKKKKKKKKEGKGQDKLLDWVDRPAKRSKFDRIVILKNMFDHKEFERDPTIINELKGDLRSECEKFGEIKKIIIFDRNPEGVASILFVEAEFADKCIEALNGRFYAKKSIEASTYDGVTNYQVQETEDEMGKRLKEWEMFIGDEQGGEKGQEENKAETEKQEQCEKQENPKEETS